MEDDDGNCDPPGPNREIYVADDLNQWKEMEVVIHELLHGADWSKDEEWVELTAKEIIMVLGRLFEIQKKGNPSRS